MSDTSTPLTAARMALRATGAVMLLACLLFPRLLHAAEPAPLVLLVQPVLNEDQTRKAYQPLCDFIGQLAGRRCRLQTAPNFLAYWHLVQRDQGIDFVMDAAHFTDYRTQKTGYSVIAKIPDTVSYSLITPRGESVFDPQELLGKTIATLGPPSIGAARLNAMFPNPMRQPTIREVANAEEGFDLLAKKRVQAAILPTPVVGQRLAQKGDIYVVMTTEPIPHLALSASPRVDPVLREKVRQAVLAAPNSPDGRAMLKGIGFERFDPASAETYHNQSRVLKQYWGY